MPEANCVCKTCGVSALAAEYGVSVDTVAAIVNGAMWNAE